MVTTKEFEGETGDKNLEFFVKAGRITAALSRSKDGLMIEVNFNLLLLSEIWRHFTAAATRNAPVEMPSCVNFVATGERFGRDDTGLVQLPEP